MPSLQKQRRTLLSGFPHRLTELTMATKATLLRVEYNNARRRWAICTHGDEATKGEFVIGRDDTTRAAIIAMVEGQLDTTLEVTEHDRVLGIYEAGQWAEAITNPFSI